MVNINYGLSIIFSIKNRYYFKKKNILNS